MGDSVAEDTDLHLPLITVVFRPYLVDNFHLTAEFLSLLYSKNAVNDEIMGYTEQILREESPVSVLLDRLARVNRKGTYTAFIECLRSKGNGYIADFIEGISLVDDESRDRWRHLIQVYHDQLNKMEPGDMLPYLHCLSQEEREGIRQTAENHGRTRGAVSLLSIVPKKWNEGFGQLLEGLKHTGHANLAKELSELFCSSSPCAEEDDMDDCCCTSSTTTGGVVDFFNEFESSTPVENTSGCDSSTVACFLEETEELSLSRNGDSSEDVQPLKLHGYQEELVANALQGRNSVIVAPTGSGKTFVAARLIKAFLDRENGVGPRNGNPPEVIRHGPNKVVFLVNKVPLLEQPCNVFRKYMNESSIMGLSGEMSNFGSVVDLLVENDIIVMTAQILVNALQGNNEDNGRMELSKIGLLILDECHHCQKGDPYNIIMAHYCDLKLSSPETARPQVLGLTASMGVGKASNRYEAETHIMKKCANLDAEALCTVQDPENKKELQQIRDKPEEEIFSLPGRKNDDFVKEINAIMVKIESKISQTPGGNTWMKESNIPKRRGTQAYENWLVEMEKYLVEKISDENNRRRLTTCKDHLKEYNCSLYINRDARTQDALDHFRSYLERLENGIKDFNQDEQQLVDLFKKKLAHFKALATSQDPALENPLLQCLARILKDSLAADPNSRGILFCQTRATAKAVHAWLQATPSLMFLQAGIMMGSGGSEGMTQTKQGEMLSLFREGKHRLIVATSVAEEGLDIQQCNVVIRSNYISNEIGRVQAQGRSRARGGKFFLVVSEELSLSNREIRNCVREKMMYQATESLQKMQLMNPQAFQEKIVEFQQNSRLERQVKERALARLQHNRELMAVSLLCRKCSKVVCTLDDIRCIENAHHVVLSETFPKRCKLVPHEKPIKKVDFEKLKKVLCGGARCSQEWGIQMKYKGVTVFALTPVNFIFQTERGTRRSFRKWKEVSYKIATMTFDDLSELMTMECKEENDESDDDNDIWAPS